MAQRRVVFPSFLFFLLSFPFFLPSFLFSLSPQVLSLESLVNSVGTGSAGGDEGATNFEVTAMANIISLHFKLSSTFLAILSPPPHSSSQ